MTVFLSRDKRQQMEDRLREERIHHRQNLQKALELLRGALDSDDWMSAADINRLHDSEELLSRELGHPIWSDPKRSEVNRLRAGEVQS